MHNEILTLQQNKLLPFIKNFFPEFGLVGGTAIALYLGHRRSIDFDLFCLKPFSILNIKNKVLNSVKIEHTFIQGDSELTILVNQVKITFYYFPYKINFNKNFDNIIDIPDMLTLGAMKAFALGKRAKWKDYVDIYFLIKSIGIKKIIDSANTLFGPEFNEKIFRVQLGYFEDIDYSENVEFMSKFETDKDTISNFLKEKSLE